MNVCNGPSRRRASLSGTLLYASTQLGPGAGGLRGVALVAGAEHCLVLAASPAAAGALCSTEGVGRRVSLEGVARACPLVLAGGAFLPVYVAAGSEGISFADGDRGAEPTLCGTITSVESAFCVLVDSFTRVLFHPLMPFVDSFAASFAAPRRRSAPTDLCSG